MVDKAPTYTARVAPDAASVQAWAVELWPEVQASLRLTEDLSAPVPERNEKREYFACFDGQDRGLTIRIEAGPLPEEFRNFRVHVNTTSENHVIQLSDQLEQHNVGLELAYAASELVAVRRRADAALPPPRMDLISTAAVHLEDPRRRVLSDRELSRVAELDWRAHQMSNPALSPEERRDARDGFSATLDDLRLRITTDKRHGRLYRTQANAAVFRFLAIDTLLGREATTYFHELNRPLEELAPDDAVALRAHRASIAALRNAQDRTDPEARRQLDGPFAQASAGSRLATAAWQAAEARADLSAQTLAALREASDGAPIGVLPRRKVMIGGGAALTGRDADALLIDGRGRWHLDPIRGIVQSADQVRHIYNSGIGDPYDWAAPRDRVPLGALQLWEDTAAVRGPLVDGHANLTVDANGRLVADVEPLDGSTPIRVEAEGMPVVATGVAPEITPGASRRVPTVPEALATVRTHLLADRSEPAMETLDAITRMPGSHQDAIDALTLLERAGLDRGDQQFAEAMTTLRATAEWDRARRDAPGRVLYGDEVANNTYDPQAGNTWLLAGIGGAASANAEIILEANPDATVVMVGTEAPWVLQNDAQFLPLRRQHDRSVNPDATGRIVTVPNRRLGMVATVPGPDGQPVVQMMDDKGGEVCTDDGTPVRGDVYVACLGRVARMPPALEGLDAWAEQVDGELMFNVDRQYLGYRLSFRNGDVQHDVEVTGAASWLLPANVFDDAAVQLVNEVGERDAPRESGNAPAGFMVAALQGRMFAEAKTKPGMTTGPLRGPDLAELRRVAGVDGPDHAATGSRATSTATATKHHAGKTSRGIHRG